MCVVFFHQAQHAAVDGGVVVEQGGHWSGAFQVMVKVLLPSFKRQPCPVRLLLIPFSINLKLVMRLPYLTLQMLSVDARLAPRLHLGQLQLVVVQALGPFFRWLIVKPL